MSTTIMALVESQRSQIEVALPKGVNVDRVIRMTRTVLNTNEFVQKCGPRSILGAVIECAQLGLAPGVTAHIVPFYDNKTKGYKATMIADYRGLMELARRSGEVQSIYADVVREGDVFEFERGAEPKLVHKPMLGNRGPVMASYAVAHWKGGGLPQFEVVDRVELDKVRDGSLGKIRSEAAQRYSPWNTNEEAMQKKTAIRRLCKFLPISTENVDLQRAIILDEAADRGEQNLGATIDADFEAVDSTPEQPMGDDQKAALAQDIDAARASA